MIFNLPPILGLIPLIFYLVMCIRGKDLLLTSTITFIFAAILTGQNLISIGAIFSSALSSFVVLVGFIILMGSGLGEVLKQTGVAQNMVHFSVKKMNIKTQRTALIVAFAFSFMVVALLGTLAGGIAVLAPILVPIAATLGVYPGALGLMMLCGGFIGMVCGPFTPTAVTIRTLADVSMSEYYLGMALPFVMVMVVVCFYFTFRLQNTGGDGERYTEEDKVSISDFVTSKDTNRATIAFLAAIIFMLAYGIMNSAGSSYAIVIMLVSSIVTGFAAKRKFSEFSTMFCSGAGNMFRLFLLFLLIGPVLEMISQSGAYDALIALVQPLFNADNPAPFVLISSAVGIWGISGAAVAQAQLIHDLFYGIAQNLGISQIIWGNIIMYGCVLTSFAIPSPDIMGPLSFARSSNMKVVLKTGYMVIIIMMIILAIRASL